MKCYEKSVIFDWNLGGIESGSQAYQQFIEYLG